MDNFLLCYHQQVPNFPHRISTQTLQLLPKAGLNRLPSKSALTFWRPRRRAYRVVDLKVPNKYVRETLVHSLISLRCSLPFRLRLTENQALTPVTIFQTRGFKEHKRNKRQPLHHGWLHYLCHGARTQLQTSWLANIDVWPIGMELVCFHEYHWFSRFVRLWGGENTKNTI